MTTPSAPERDQQQEARTRLEERRAELLVSIAALGGDATAAPATLGETEHLAAYQQRDVDGALVGMLITELAEVDGALARLDDGTYGTCEGCHSPIAPERLEAVPAARTCVRCA